MSRTRTEKQETKQVRCAIYTRKSSEEGLEMEFNSLDAQREAGEAYIASQKSEGWIALPDRYDDGGFTGGNMDRPALLRLMKAIEADKIDCVVVYKVDRLSRSLMDFARMVEVFEKHNISFVSVTQHFNTTHSMGRLTLNILLSFAQFEREIIGERIRDKIAAQRKRGLWSGGVPILGYDVDRSNGRPSLKVNAAEAARVREIFKLYLELESLLPVVQELEGRGWNNKAWRTKAGVSRGNLPFDKSTTYCLLTNPLYIGLIRYKGETYPGEHEPIVEPEVFARVQTLLKQHGRSGGREVNRTGILLRGLLYCKACGKAMTHTFTSKRNKKYRYYTCQQAMKRGWEKCPAKSLPAGEIERVVVEQIRDITKDKTLLAKVLKQAKDQAQKAIDRLRAELRDLERELARHHADIRKLAGQELASAGNTARIAELNERIQRDDLRKAEVAAKIAEQEQEQIEDGEVPAAFAEFDNVWGQLSPKEKVKLVKLLVARVEYDARDGTLSVMFHESGIKTLAQGQAEKAA